MMVRKMLIFTYVMLTAILLTIGYIFEEPYGFRKYALFVMCFLYFFLANVKWIAKKKDWLMTMLLLIMVLLLMGIEINSKYAVNYFFHTIYLLLIFYVIMLSRQKYSIHLSIIMTLISFYKFIQLIGAVPTFSNISLLVFFGSFQLLIVVIGIFVRIYQEESEKTKRLYSELLGAHSQLKAYSHEIRTLTEMEAKTNIARDLHDTLGHEMTGLIMQMEMATNFYEEGSVNEGREMLEASKQSARESLKKVRTIVETLKKNDEVSSIETSIRELIETFSHKTGCEIFFDEKGKRYLKPEVNIVLYRVIQESMTNALRHGKATGVKIDLIYNETAVLFSIEDNGIGCETIKYGNGLKGIRERLEEVGGTVEFISLAVDSGFVVKGNLPYERI